MTIWCNQQVDLEIYPSQSVYCGFQRAQATAAEECHAILWWWLLWGGVAHGRGGGEKALVPTNMQELREEEGKRWQFDRVRRVGARRVFLGWVRRGFQHGPTYLKRRVARQAHMAVAHPTKRLLDWKREFGAHCDKMLDKYIRVTHKPAHVQFFICSFLWAFFPSFLFFLLYSQPFPYGF